MNNKRPMSDNDEELIDTLLAISVVSKRLARKLCILTIQRQSTEGGYPDEQHERDVRDARRAAQACCRTNGYR